MESVRLLSEHFETAARGLRHSMDSFGQLGLPEAIDRFSRAVDDFRTSVDKLVKMNGMIAENQHRTNCGQQVAYDEQSFVNL